jgi:hypothetical protein
VGDTFADPLGGLDDAAWDAIAGDRFYSGALWLRLCALAGGAVCGGVHVDLPGGQRAAVPVAAVTDEPNPHCRWADKLTEWELPAPDPQGILVGARRGYHTDLLSTPDADRSAVAAALLRDLRALRHPDAPLAAPPCVAMYLPTEDALALRGAGATALPVALATDAWIEIPPGGWDAWLDSLGAHRARRIRREVRDFEAAGYELETTTLERAYDQVAGLLARTEARHGREVDVAALSASFREQGELAGSRAHVVLCSTAPGRPAAAFCLYYQHGDTVFLRAVGFDREELKSAAEYFNLTYYLPARLPGVRRLHAGITTAEGKALRGATLRPLWLLDLTEDSVLAGRDAEVRKHNQEFLAGLRAISPAVERALPEDLWTTFC